MTHSIKCQRRLPHPPLLFAGHGEQLLGLLASGSTDAAIARAFGWSERTVQRHIHDLMTAWASGT
jgi:DNA-binding NarL/FixJ family response regulator